MVVIRYRKIRKRRIRKCTSLQEALRIIEEALPDGFAIRKTTYENNLRKYFGYN
jgi:hypothetical protein